jgi:hypothetical protein
MNHFATPVRTNDANLHPLWNQYLRGKQPVTPQGLGYAELLGY